MQTASARGNFKYLAQTKTKVAVAQSQGAYKSSRRASATTTIKAILNQSRSHITASWELCWNGANGDEVRARHMSGRLYSQGATELQAANTFCQQALKKKQLDIVVALAVFVVVIS